MSQIEYWKKVNDIKKKVHDRIGTNLSREFKSSQVYQAYTGLCGEAQIAFENKELDDEILKLLEEYAEKVIDLHNTQSI